MFYITLFSILISTWMIGKCYGKMSGIKAIVLGTTNYFFFYILCSALLFWVDYYSIKKAVVGTCTAVVLVAIVCAFVFRQKVSFFLRKRELYALLIICLLTLPLTIQKFEFFGMGQDEGVYQTKAIELINGNNQRIFDFWEYEKLTDEEKETYRTKVDWIGGLDQFDRRKPGLENIEGITDVAGIYHGIPTYPSILAMFAKYFGLSHMQDGQTLFLLLMLMTVYYILENLGVKYWIRLLAMGILGISPEVLWVSKSALTEMFLAVILTTFIMLITEKKEHMRFLSFIPVVIFGFYHVSVYATMPMFIVLYWLLYYFDKKKITYIASCCLSIVGYVVGFHFMVYISPTYTTNNYLSRLTFLTNGTIVRAVTIAAVFLVVATIIYALLMRNKYVNALVDKIWAHRAIVYKAALGAMLLFLVLKNVFGERTLAETPQIGLVAIAVATGCLLVPLSIGKLLTIKNSAIKNRNDVVIYVTFLYGTIFYYVFLRGFIRNFFYYGRYMVPYLFIAVVMFAVLFNKVKRRYVVATCLVGMISFISPIYYLCTNLDDTRAEWDVVEETLDEIQGYNSAVLLAQNSVRIMAMPIQSLGCDIYFATEDVAADAEKLAENYEKVYYVTFSDEALSSDFEIRYKKETYTYMDHQTKLHTLSAYPIEYTKEEKPFTIYNYVKHRKIYNIGDGGDFLGAGFGNIEKKVVWTNSTKADVTCYVDRNDYTVKLHQGAKVPLKELGLEKYDINVYVNDVYLNTLIINKENNGGTLEFFVPQSLLVEGRNVISFESNLWSPTDYGKKDARKLGFGLAGLEFVEAE